MHWAFAIVGISLWAIILAGCLIVVVSIPMAAARHKLHIPGYVGIAFVSFVTGLLIGWISGFPGISGTPTGLFLSILFFLLIASTVGSIIALFFYRHPDV